MLSFMHSQLEKTNTGKNWVLTSSNNSSDQYNQNEDALPVISAN